MRAHRDGRSDDRGRLGSTLGRPSATTHAAIERAAFALFEDQGFEATTLDDIAAALGVGRRTLFRYYPSKNDILWGRFDDSLRNLERILDQTAEGTPILDAVQRAILAFNEFEPDAIPQHRQRMRLLLTTPALLAHSELRYAAWRDVIARYVAGRTALRPTDVIPCTVGRVSLALSLSAYEQWLRDEESALADCLAATFAALSELVSDTLPRKPLGRGSPRAPGSASPTRDS